MDPVASILVILLIVIAAAALMRAFGGPVGPAAGPAPRERIVEREVQRPKTERVIERPSAQDRVVEREVVHEDPDGL